MRFRSKTKRKVSGSEALEMNGGKYCQTRGSPNLAHRDAYIGDATPSIKTERERERENVCLNDARIFYKYRRSSRHVFARRRVSSQIDFRLKN